MHIIGKCRDPEMARFYIRKAVLALISITAVCFVAFSSVGLFQFHAFTNDMVGYDIFPKNLPTPSMNHTTAFAKLTTPPLTKKVKPTTSTRKPTSTAKSTIPTVKATASTLKNVASTTITAALDRANTKLLQKYIRYAKSLSKQYGSKRKEFQAKCKKLKISTGMSPEKVDRLILSGVKKVIMCDTPKVASTSFRKTFADSHGNTNGTKRYFYYAQDIFWAKHLDYNWVTQSAIPTYFKLLATRNPYSRLMSAYRDKIAPSNEALRKNESGVDGNARPVALYAKEHDPDFKRHGTTFEMFLRYVTDTYNKTNSNLHWRAVTDTCFPCAFPFDYVGKLEDLRTKEQLLTFLYKNESIAAGLEFPTDHQSHTNSSRILMREYSKVSKSVIAKIQEVYKNDFLLFGYSLNPY